MGGKVRYNNLFVIENVFRKVCLLWFFND